MFHLSQGAQIHAIPPTKIRDVLVERVDSTVDRENPLVKLVLFISP